MTRIRLTHRWFHKTLAFFRDPRVSVWKKALGVFAVVYFFAPLDAIPDFIPVLGWLDDLGVLAFAGSYLAAQIDRHSKDAGRDDGLPRPLEPVAVRAERRPGERSRS